MSHEHFTVRSESISVGDGTMRYARFPAPNAPGLYQFRRGALAPVTPGLPASRQISLDSPFIFVLDTDLEEAFNTLYHEIAGPLSYDITQVAKQHDKIQAALGARVALYWEGAVNLSGEHREGTYTLDPQHMISVSS